MANLLEMRSLTAAYDTNVVLEDINFTVKPNPTKGIIEISCDAPSKDQSNVIKLMTLTGIVVDQFNWDGVSARIDLSKHASGVYILVIQSQERTEMKKVIVQ